MAQTAKLPDRLVLYDGVCGLCDRTVQFLLDHDPEGKLRFAPLSGATAASVLTAHPELAGVDSIVFVERSGDDETISVRSKAVFRIAGYLDRRVRWLRVFGVLPQAIADAGYDSVAAVRYRVFGKLDTCRIPSPEVRSRFLA